MRGLYTHRFALPNGVTVCIPSDKGRERGEQVARAIRERWKPKRNYFHLKEGGHVAAAKRHAASKIIAKLDLAGFYHQVSRSKVHRGLKDIGVPQQEAWEAACDSTVERNKGRRNYSLPFGFVQSPLLASVVLDHSALGKAIQRLDGRDCFVSAYVDDVIVSSDSEQSVKHALVELRHAASLSGFEINEQKSEGPSSEITAFNIHLGNGRMEISVQRMADFQAAILDAFPERIAGILEYVKSVNAQQMQTLAALLSDPREHNQPTIP